MRRRFGAISASHLLPLACLAGVCVGLAVVLASPVATISLISVEDEIRIGREAQRQVRKEVPRLADRVVSEYVTRLGRQLAARAPGPKYPYTFSVANRRDLNAFALPGGPVWIHRGIIQAAANESQLAGVLAHEIAHIAERHAADQLTKRLVANGLLGLLGAMLGNDGGGARTAQIGAGILAGGYMLKFSRDDERDADRVGLLILQRAGWNPRGMAEFMETLTREHARNSSAADVFLSSHPAPAERAHSLRRAVGARSEGRRDSGTFRSIKQRMRR